MVRSSRRSFATGAVLSGCAYCFAPTSLFAASFPTLLTPLVPPGYEPTDVDERGLWQACDRLEEKLASSNLIVDDEPLNDYLWGVVDRLLEGRGAELRLYVVRDPSFNASMAPNGMMTIHTGLLARARNEAQLASVLGHESGHYLRRHSVRGWRDAKSKTAAMAVIGVLAGAASGATGNNWFDLATGINAALAQSLFSFSRDLESEADVYGLQLLQRGGYQLPAAAQVWAQLIEERKASAAARNKRYTDSARSSFSTHPPSDSRMLDLDALARELERIADGGPRGEDGRDRWRTAIAPVRRSLLEEQVRLNDSGANLYLIQSLAHDGWDGSLRYYEGEIYRMRGADGDVALAAAAYAAATTHSDAPPEAFRAHGYAQLKSGRTEEGRSALQHYLNLSPSAVDAEMIRFTLNQ